MFTNMPQAVFNQAYLMDPYFVSHDETFHEDVPMYRGPRVGDSILFTTASLDPNHPSTST